MKNIYLITVFFFLCLLSQPLQAQGPIVHLPLNTDLNDGSGNNLHATDAGDEATVFVEDATRGTVARFPIAAHAQLPLDPKLDFGTEDFSVAFWVKVDNAAIPGSDPVIIGNKDWGSGGNPGFLVALDGANEAGSHLWTVNVADGAGGRLDWDADDNATPTLTDNQWHFVAVVFDRDATMNVYLDGELRQSDVAEDSKNLTLVPGDLGPDALPLTIMQDATGAYSADFEAFLDDILVYDRVLTAEEVTELNENGYTVNPSLGADVYLPFDGNLNDASGNNLHAVDAGTEATVFVEDAARGTVARFPIAAHAQLPLDPKLDFGTEDFSVAFWVKVDNAAIPGSDPVIIGNKDWGSGGNPGFLVALDGANEAGSHLWTVNVADGAGGRLDWDADDNATPTLTDNQWHFVAVVFDRDATMNVYLDGELRQSDVAEDSKNLTLVPGDLAPDALPLTIMQDATGAYSADFEAFLDDVRVWKGKALNAEEINEVFGFVVEQPNDEAYGADIYLPLDTDLNDLTANAIHATDAGTETTQFVEDAIRGTVAEFPVAAHAQFPADAPLLDFGTEDFSMAFWIKIDPNLSTPGDPVILGNKDWGSGGNPGFLVGLDGADDPAAHLWTVNVADGAGGRLDWDADDNQTPNLKDGYWHLVALAFDRDATLNVYLDGELRQSDPADDAKNLTLTPGSLTSPYPLTIMQDATGAYGDDFVARLDNIRIWKKVISAEEVATIFEMDKGNGTGGEGEIVLGNNPLEEIPDNFKVYPNPIVNGQASIRYYLAAPSDMSISIYNRVGLRIQTVLNEKMAAGEHTLNWDASAYPSGLYYFRIEGDHLKKTTKVILLK
ncbi:LamG-like jellyroll fold domain-containing protein [Catalinimonas niigatensis]|uniref:LamG-like jellyroll fold domain-containing protein n=1 Tax=Catalinimonas niigatensis TaxID=1397264 RepID=UPI002666758C|nr:LamG-like jellyroll fold domain-containing protein [Catalinimonas niigatensis]WPP50838.1 LamG-like jellyroll fold domain-containing protein [Catalinimonas niigatensis]